MGRNQPRKGFPLRWPLRPRRKENVPRSQCTWPKGELEVRPGPREIKLRAVQIQMIWGTSFAFGCHTFGGADIASLSASLFYRGSSGVPCGLLDSLGLLELAF